MRDEHCHIIWDVDDGSVDESMTEQMLLAAKNAGITHIVCTPHMRWNDFSQEKVEERFAIFADRAAAQGLTTSLGYEVYYKTLLHIGLDQAPRFVEQGTNNLIIEFNTGGEVPFGWDHTFYDLQSVYGLDITVAHPERYTSVLQDFDIVYRMKDMGCRIQVSAMDLFRGIFDAGSKCAKRLMKEGLCDALVSDAHNPAHYESYVKAVQKYNWC